MMEGEQRRSRFSSRSWSITEAAIRSVDSEVEVREDEEQGAKLQEIMELLLAAGYFRARIKGLSAFDMVVGGMTWCIEVCNVDIDVDLLFQENLTIGQKIALTEKIVAVLPKMQCPYQLEPHQIQGLDSIHIYPVVQWLVKKAIETRQEVGDYVRAYAISQFNKAHVTPKDVAFQSVKENISSTLQTVQSSYKPQRQYRHHAPQKIREEEIRVQTTLLEYGRQYGWVSSTSSKDDRSASQAEAASDSASENIPASHIEKLMSGMSAMEEQESKLAASVVGGIVGLQSSEIQQIASEYASKQAELSLEKGEYVGGAQQQHMRTVAALKKQITLKREELENIKKEHETSLNNYNKTREKLKELHDKQAKLTADLRKLDEMESTENKTVLQQLRSLVTMNEQLKQQELEFRAHCVEEKDRLTKAIENLKSSTEEGTSENEERNQLILKQYEADKLKLRKVRLLLANKNREIAIIQRKIDEVPSRAELSQYQRRFVELYNQVAAKHKETKQFYTLYNTLDDTRMYLSKEVSLLNSILDNFSEAMSSPSTREQFLSQFEQIVEGIKQNKKKVEKKKQEEKMKRDQLNDYYLDLIEKQRLYFKAIKDFKEECRHNEVLIAKLKERSQ